MSGLTNEQVQERLRDGKVNINDSPNTRTYRQIIHGNVFTFFNFLNAVLFVLVILVGSLKNGLFMMVSVINTIIGIVQEIRAKIILDDLSIMTQQKTVVLREGRQWSIRTDRVVLDDLIYLKAGDQVPADCVLEAGSLEVNESLLTGESDNLSKGRKDSLYSGSFVASGKAWCRVVHVGSDNYASRITREAKEFRQVGSELRSSINAILKVISIIIVPVGALLFYKQFVLEKTPMRSAVVGMVAGVLGMIPEGLVLLTGIALTLGALRLALKKTLVQELYCIETLARVDTLCLDKTGTLTKGTMKVEEVVPYHAYSEEEIEKVMGNLMRLLPDDNATANALRERFSSADGMEEKDIIPFSSERKYSGVSFTGEGTWLVGAAQFLFPEGQEDLFRVCDTYASQGERVLVLAHTEEMAKKKKLPGGLSPAALIVLTDVLRENAAKTLAYFYEQGVDLKIISGDDPATVAAVARAAGLKEPEKYVDASTIKDGEELEKAMEQYNVFGRVTPQQKKEMVKALRAAKHTVAMTGDGVNDVLALKEADCGIAMASGSSAAKNTADVVLLSSDFSSMPEIVNQGRRVVNNIRTAASMFLIKTMFSILLALITIFWGEAYPFEPIQMSLISACSVGIPTFLLAQENNYAKIDHTFLRHVFMNAFPAAVTISGSVFIIMLVCQNGYHSLAMLGTACFLVTGWNYMSALRTVYAPLNWYRRLVILGMQVIFFAGAVVARDMLGLASLEFGMIILVFLLMSFAPVLTDAVTEWVRRVYARYLVKASDKAWYQRLIAALMGERNPSK